ncbi:hypothetical protein QYE76_053115 [Lolium multiflorum]|uniref:Uncharacterized protein n=1 Tax=Lolium multiflorum TaxID=4521 RepID=A0AAD8SWL6_LOLMU|nr:hypothetical protein QYE76_053115 [Lolium multiflorum]
MAELKKGNKTVNTYFHELKALSDSLTSIGELLRDAEFVSYILAGLDEELQNNANWLIVAQVAPRIILLHTLLHLLHLQLPMGPAVVEPVPQHHPPRPHLQPPHPSRMVGMHLLSISCVGLRAMWPLGVTYKKFNRDFLGLGNDGSVTEKQLAMAMSASHGSQGASQSIDPTWYADSGATHHITSELDKLTSREPYHDTDQVHTANGTAIRRGSRLDVFTPTPSEAHVDHGLHGNASDCMQPCTTDPPTELGSALGSVPAEPGVSIEPGCSPTSGFVPAGSISASGFCPVPPVAAALHLSSIMVRCVPISNDSSARMRLSSSMACCMDNSSRSSTSAHQTTLHAILPRQTTLHVILPRILLLQLLVGPPSMCRPNLLHLVQLAPMQILLLPPQIQQRQWSHHRLLLRRLDL